jgi:hypothetical protein
MDMGTNSKSTQDYFPSEAFDINLAILMQKQIHEGKTVTRSDAVQLKINQLKQLLLQLEQEHYCQEMANERYHISGMWQKNINQILSLKKQIKELGGE